MNKIEIKQMKKGGPHELTMVLTPHCEACFNEHVFPKLFDGNTTGVRSVLKGGCIRYVFLVYDDTFLNVFKQVMVNTIMAENGQMN